MVCINVLNVTFTRASNAKPRGRQVAACNRVQSHIYIYTRYTEWDVKNGCEINRDDCLLFETEKRKQNDFHAVIRDVVTVIEEDCSYKRRKTRISSKTR